jgi:hypothetical protein
MKKTLLTIAIVLGMTLGAVAQKQNGGLFGMGAQRQTEYDYYNRDGESNSLLLPNTHGETADQAAPLGSGALLLIGFSAAYALRKKNNK